MSIKILTGFFDSLRLTARGLPVFVTGSAPQQRSRNRVNVPRLRYPYWYTKQERDQYEEHLTSENDDFIKEILYKKYGPPTEVEGVSTFLHTALKKEPVLKGTWFPNCRRSGLIAIKLGILPQWTKDGKMMISTLLQVLDNHVIKYIPPGTREDLRHYHRANRSARPKKLGSLVVGAINADPQRYTREYCGLFTSSGVMPKKILTKFEIHPSANIQPGTPLYAAHFRVGDFVDVTGKTIYRNFQGVMKRWGFKGMPASHGQTKTHRRPGNICGGGKKARVIRGKKLPGHVGNKTRTSRALQIIRINHKYNVIYVKGRSIPGPVNSFVYIHDTLIPTRKVKTAPPFPTYYPEDHKEELPEEEFADSVFVLSSPSIQFSPEVQKARKSTKLATTKK